MLIIKMSFWHLLILLPIHLEVLANSTDMNITSKNVSDVEFTTKKFSNNIMKLNLGIRLPIINTSLSKSPEIENNSLPLHHWRKHIHHSKRHRKSLENSRKHHIASLSSQKNNLSFVLPMNWKRNKLNISPLSRKDPQQIFANLIHRLMNSNNNLSVLSTYPPVNYNSPIINTENIQNNMNNTINFIVSYNHTTNNSGLLTSKFFNESYIVCNITGNLNNQSCNEDHMLNSSIYKTTKQLKENLTTPSSFLDRLKILTKSPNKTEELNEQLKGDTFLRIIEKKLLLSSLEKSDATTKSNFIIIDDLGFFGDPTEETPLIKSREIFHSRPSLIDYLFAENNDNTASEIENRMKYIDLWNLETNKTKTIDPEVLKIKFKLSGDTNDHYLPPWRSDNIIYSSKISEPQYNSQINNKRVEVKVKDHFIPLQSIKQSKSKVLNESDFQSAFLSTFYSIFFIKN